MKKYLLTLCVVSLPLHAAMDFAQNDQRNINDLMYLPVGGTFYGQTSLDALAGSSDLSVNGDKYSTTKTTGTSASQAVGYAFTDRLFLSAGVDYSFKSTSKTDYETQADDTSDSKGLGDPSVAGRIRVMEQKDGSINLDLLPTYSFSSGPSKSDGNSGDNKNGGTSYGLDLQGGKKFSDLQVSAGIGWSHSDISTSKDTSTGTKSKSPASDSYNFNISVQKFLKEKLYLNLLGGLVFFPAEKSKSSGSTIKTPTRVTSIFAGQLGYLVLPNVTFEGGLALVATSDYQAKDDSGNKYDVEKLSYALLNATLKYQF
jgi:hypothetical protein